MLDAIIHVIENTDPQEIRNMSAILQITGFFVLFGFIYYTIETVLGDLSRNKK